MEGTVVVHRMVLKIDGTVLIPLPVPSTTITLTLPPPPGEPASIGQGGKVLRISRNCPTGMLRVKVGIFQVTWSSRPKPTRTVGKRIRSENRVRSGGRTL